MNYTEFATKIKTKYPVYKDIPDLELANKVIAKYPVYKEQVTFEQSKPITPAIPQQVITEPQLGKEVLPTKEPTLEWTSPITKEPEIRAMLPSEIQRYKQAADIPANDVIKTQFDSIIKNSLGETKLEDLDKYKARTGTLMFIASAMPTSKMVQAGLVAAAKSIPMFGKWAMTYPKLAYTLKEMLVGAVSGVASKEPEMPLSKAAVEGAVTNTVFSVAGKIVEGIAPRIIKGLGKRPLGEIPRKPAEVIPEQVPMEAKPTITPEPVKPPTVRKVTKPSVIPDLKSTEEAIAFGKTIKNKPEIIQQLKTAYVENTNQFNAIKDIAGKEQEAMNIAVKGQLMREAYETAEKTVTVKPAVTEILTKPETVKQTLVTEAKTQPAKFPITPKGEVIVFPTGKQNVLNEIEQAIKIAPLKANAIKGDTVSFKIDGGFNIENNKEALQIFYKNVKSTPDKIKTGIEPYKEHKLPTSKSAYQEEMEELLKINNNKGYITDGKFIVKSEPPKNAIYEKRTVNIKDVEKMLNKKTQPAEIQYYFVNELKEKGISDRPLPKLKDIENYVLFKSNNKNIVINQSKLNVIQNRYPNAKYGITDDMQMLVAYDKGKPVGALMATSYEKSINEFEQKVGYKQPVTPEVTKVTPELESQKFKDIISESKSMFEAQKRIKTELNLDVDIATLKKQEPQIKGGLPPDMSEPYIKTAYNNIKNRVKGENITENYGVNEVANITDNDIRDNITFFESIGDRVRTYGKNLKEAINNFELVQNYLYSKPETRPITEGIIDAYVKQVKMKSNISILSKLIKNVDNKELVAKILTKLDRTGIKYEDIISKYPQLTDNDKIGIESIFSLVKIKRDRLIEDILNSRLGIRIKSNGKRYFVDQKWQTEKQTKNLLQKFPHLKVQDTKEEFIFKNVDPQTGKYITKRMFFKDIGEATKQLKTEEQNLINQILPYGEYNYIPHNRREGTHWIEVFEPTIEGEEKIYSARVKNLVYAEKMKNLISKQMPSARISIKPHSKRMIDMPSFGTIADVQHYMAERGIKVESETGQRIINAYRSMSPLMSSMIQAQNIAGYRVDFNGIAESVIGEANSSISRGFRIDVNELKSLLKDVKDDFNYNTALKYLNALSTVNKSSPILDAGKSFIYYSLLANKPSYVIQNVTEPLWALARIGKTNKPLLFFKPLEKEYTELLNRADDEGLTKAFAVTEFGEKNILNKLDIFGKMSESFSSKKVFEIGLRDARDKGIKGEQAYKHAYQFLFNTGKPFYHNANTLVGLLDKEAGLVNRYGFIFMRWVTDFINKTARLDTSGKLKTFIVWSLLAGMSTIPFMRPLLNKLGITKEKEDIKNMSLEKKFIINGVPGTLGLSSDWLAPIYGKTFTKIGEMGGITQSINIISNQVKSAERNWDKYGTIGLIGSLPLAGLERPVLGITKAEKGILEKSGKYYKKVFKPQTPTEYFYMSLGLTPLRLQEYYKQKYK